MASALELENDDRHLAKGVCTVEGAIATFPLPPYRVCGSTALEAWAVGYGLTSKVSSGLRISTKFWEGRQ